MKYPSWIPQVIKEIDALSASEEDLAIPDDVVMTARTGIVLDQHEEMPTVSIIDTNVGCGLRFRWPAEEYIIFPGPQTVRLHNKSKVASRMV